jgi:hypothetical protein
MEFYRSRLIISNQFRQRGDRIVSELGKLSVRSQLMVSMFLSFRLDIFKVHLHVMMWCVFNRNYVQILDKIVQFNFHAVFDGHYVGKTVSTVSVNFQH